MKKSSKNPGKDMGQKDFIKIQKMPVPERIKHLRKNVLNVSQREFAQICGIRQHVTIGNLERGSQKITSISVGTLMSIAKTCRIPLWVLIDY